MKFLSLVFCLAILASGCQKGFIAETPDLPPACRLIKTDWYYDSALTITFNIQYDALNRVSSTKATYTEDSSVVFYNGNTSVINKLSHLWGSRNPSFDFVYDPAGLPKLITGVYNKVEFINNGDRIDSANFYYSYTQPTTQWDYMGGYRFQYSSNNRLTGYQATFGTEGYSTAEIEYTALKNNLRGFVLLNFENNLRLEDLMPLSRFGLADEYLPQFYEIRTYSTNNSESVERFDCKYEFDAADNLIYSEITHRVNGQVYRNEIRRYYYDCS